MLSAMSPRCVMFGLDAWKWNDNMAAQYWKSGSAVSSASLRSFFCLDYSLKQIDNYMYRLV